MGSRALAFGEPWLRRHSHIDLVKLSVPAHPKVQDGALPDGCVQLMPAQSRWRKAGLDKHGLDVALSIGRHAAERAKLSGACSVIGVHVVSQCADAPHRPGISGRGGRGSSSEPYEELRIVGSVGIAALVGLVVASAQIGLKVMLPGQDGWLAMSLAIRVHPGVESWLAREQPEVEGLRLGAV